MIIEDYEKNSAPSHNDIAGQLLQNVIHVQNSFY